MDNEIYDRQQYLQMRIPNSVAVIGVGGVGAWVALNFALTGVKKVVLVDHDQVEHSNLNRTPFKLTHVGRSKVRALTELIYERRSDCDVVPIAKRIEQCNEFEMKEITQCEEIVDCRDTISGLPDSVESKAKRITCGYDGHGVTIHLNRRRETVWGDDEHVRYTVTPSWLVPPQLLANLITTYLCKKSLWLEDEVVVSTHVDTIFKKIIEQ